MGSFHVFAYYVVVCDVHISFVGRVSGSKDSLLFSASGEGFYLTSILRTFSKDILFVGNSGNDVIGSLPEFNSDYIFLIFSIAMEVLPESLLLLSWQYL